MSAFQIRDEFGHTITIKQLDEEAAAFWNKEVDSDSYAFPTKEPNYVGMTDKERRKAYTDYIRSQSCNWYDTIGYQIAYPSINWTSGWNNVKASLWIVQAADKYEYLFDTKLYRDDETGQTFTQMDISMQVTREFLKPYYDLIDHWVSKGYQPVQIKG